MPEYRLSLDFTAADDTQAERLAEAWAGTCAAEYGTRFAGFERLDPHTTGCLLPVSHLGPCTTTVSPVRPVMDGSETSTHPGDLSAVACEWCGRAIYHVGRQWLAVKGDERGYNPYYCDAADDTGRHEPAATGT